MHKSNTSIFRSKFGKFTLPQNEEWINRPFEQGGHWEEGIINMLLFLLKENFTVVNVGTHVGTTAIPISRYVDRVFCFEPQKKLFNLLLKNIKDNDALNIVAFNGVVSNSEENKVTLKGTDHFGRDILNEVDCKVNYGGVSIGTGGEEVFNYNIDNLLGSIEINLMTIDAEGAESLVVLSAIQSIKKYRPFLLIEQNHLTVTDDMMKSLKTFGNIDIKEFLSDIGYYDPIELEGDNNLYIPKIGVTFFNGKLFTDSFNVSWLFEEDVIVDMTGVRGNFLYYSISQTEILVDFGNSIIKGTFNGDNELNWSNGTKWRLTS